MGNIFQNIFNFLLSPPGMIIIVGLIGGLGRLGAWISSERAKRAAVQAKARREAEALRTGRPVEVSMQQSGPSEPGEASAAERQRALQEQRAAQLRALQQKRLAELRARRAAQGQGGGAPATASTPRPPVRPGQSTERPQAPRSAPPRPQPRPTPRPEPERRGKPLVKPGFPPVTAVKASTAPVAATEIGSGPSAPSAAPAPRAPGVGLAALLGTQQDLRRAIVLAEILGPPVSERDPDNPGLF